MSDPATRRAPWALLVALLVAAAWQVPDARVGLVSGYGMVNYDRCLCSAAAILGVPDR